MRRVVLLRLLGGLGNQMFQYALGRRLALANDAELKLDLSAYRPAVLARQKWRRPLQLNHLKIVAAVAARMEITRIRNRGWIPPAGWILDRLESQKPYHMRHSIVEPRSNRWVFDPAISGLTVRGSVYLKHGFWQAARYLHGIEGALRDEFQVAVPAEGLNAEYLSAIREEESVAVHIRRGDYVEWPGRRGFAPLPLDYYSRASTALAEQVRNPRLWIFSDDPEWCRANLSFEQPFTVVAHNSSEEAYQDLRLMMACRHSIIANSSLSWWGAWLQQNPGRVVYAPQKYFPTHERPTPDLYPEGWRLL